MKAYAIGALIGAVLVTAITWLLLVSQSQAAQVRLRDSLAVIALDHAADTARLASERRQIEARADNFAQQAIQVKLRADSLHGSVATLERRLRALRATTIDTVSPQDTLLAVVALQDTLIDSLHAENTGLRDALTAESARSANLLILVALADSATSAERERAERLNALVRSRLPRPPGKLFGFLPKPSRGVTFVLGAVAGAVIATR